MTMAGTVEDGLGIAGVDLTSCLQSIRLKVKIPDLLAKTLNVRLSHDYIINPEPELRIDASEHHGQALSLIPCKLNGRKAIIVRADEHNTQNVDEMERLSLFEVMSDVELRATFNLNTGGEVTVDVDERYVSEASGEELRPQ